MRNEIRIVRIGTLFPILMMLLTACGGNTKDRQDLLARGEELFSTYICNTCHSLDGSEMYGPTLKDLYRQEITVVRKGKELGRIANRKYLIRAISNPELEKVKGFEDRIMPQPQISKSETKLLVDYIIALTEGS
jgi:cytochrome c oxidase subunit 2